MSKYVPMEQRPTDEIISEIALEFRNWDAIHESGCQDPFWEDGVNLNLTRNHIIWLYRILRERLDDCQMSLFGCGFDPERHGLRPVPPEVPGDWMCPTGEYPDRLIWKRAKA